MYPCANNAYAFRASYLLEMYWPSRPFYVFILFMRYKTAQWLNAEGKLDGSKAVLRKNLSAGEAKPTKPTVIMLTIIVTQTNQLSLPANDAELNALDAVEEQVADLFCQTFAAEFALTVTCDGTRDLFFYTAKVPSDNEIENEMAHLNLTYDYDFVVQEDANWDPYEILCPTPENQNTSPTS